MTVHRMDHVGLVVTDLDAGIAYFEALGLEVENDHPQPVEGEWVDRINGIEQVRVDIVMLRTPDGHGRLELTRFRNPAAVAPVPASPNALGLRSVMFAVDDVDAAVERLRPHGGELLGEVVQYEDLYRLCYISGPGGSIVALAEELG
jgi:catechol 2,3-dioxygenase-like lactoylglutathione lyase family enzyme